jgi:tRNA(Ile2) C34 agmatinyltransferase TiaS
MDNWKERECPLCSKCGERATSGNVVKFKAICSSCMEQVTRDAEEAYDKLPRNAQGKVSVRNENNK